MPVILGNTTGSIRSIALNLPSTIVSHSLTNRTGGNITVSLGVFTPTGHEIYFWSGAIATGTTQISDIPIKILNDYQILLIVSGSCDYYFTLE